MQGTQFEKIFEESISTFSTGHEALLIDLDISYGCVLRLSTLAIGQRQMLIYHGLM